MKKIYYGLMLAGALTLCTGCSSSLLDIDNPNEVTNDTYWNKPEDATAGVNACYSFFYKEGTWMRWLSFRYDLTSDEKTRAFYARHIGQTMPVLLERPKPGLPMHGFTPNYIRVEVPHDAALDNQLVSVRLGDFNADGTALLGVME